MRYWSVRFWAVVNGQMQRRTRLVSAPIGVDVSLSAIEACSRRGEQFIELVSVEAGR
jgi:hypothetical protein